MYATSSLEAERVLYIVKNFVMLDCEGEPAECAARKTVTIARYGLQTCEA